VCYSGGMEITNHQAGGIKLTNGSGIGEAIKFIRKVAGMSQRAFAALTGFRQAQIGDWENGVRRPNIESIVQILDAAGYDLLIVPRDQPRKL